MTRAKTSDIENLGFTSEMFGCVDFATFLQPILDETEKILSGRVGASVVTSISEPTSSNVILAEKNMAAAELCQRRINRLSGNIDADTAAIVAQLRKSRADYKDEVERLISSLATGAVNSADSGGYSGGVVITGSDDPTLTRLWPT